MRLFDVINCRAIIDLSQTLEIITTMRHIHTYEDKLVIFRTLFPLYNRN